MAPLKPQKREQTGSFRLQVTAPAMQEERNKRTPAVPRTQEPYQQIYKKKKKKILFKNCLHKCVAYVQSTKESCFLSPPPLRDVSTWDPFQAVSCPGAACGRQLQREGPSQTTVSYATAKRPYSKFPLPAEWTPSAFTPPSSRLHGRTLSRWCCLLLQVFSRRGDQHCKLWTSFLLPQLLPQ